MGSGSLEVERGDIAIGIEDHGVAACSSATDACMSAAPSDL
jgi:hypothetical protein